MAAPPVEAARRYVEFMGGADQVLAKAGDSFDSGDFRWVAEVVNHVVFAEPDNAEAKHLLADTYEQLGYGAENGTWRSSYLSGATELRSGSFGTQVQAASPDMVANLSVEQFFDSMAIRVNGPRAWDLDFSLDWDITDVGPYRITLRNGVLVHAPGGSDGTAQATIRLTHADLPALVLDGRPVDELPGVTVTGDHDVLARLTAVLDPPDPDFAIVTP